MLVMPVSSWDHPGKNGPENRMTPPGISAAMIAAVFVRTAA